MNKFLIATAATALLAAPALAAERTTEAQAPMTVAQAAPAVPQTGVGVQMRRNQQHDDQPAPSTPMVPNTGAGTLPAGAAGTATSGATVGGTATAPAAPSTAVGVEQRSTMQADDQPAPAATGVATPGQIGQPGVIPQTGATAEGTAAPAAPRTAVGVEERRDELVDDRPALSPVVGTQPSVGTTVAEPQATGTVTTGTVGTTGSEGVTGTAPAQPETAIGVQQRRQQNIQDGPAR